MGCEFLDLLFLDIAALGVGLLELKLVDHQIWNL